MNALRVRGVWEMDRLWKGRSVAYGLEGPQVVYAQSIGDVGSTTSVNGVGHGSTHASYKTQQGLPFPTTSTVYSSPALAPSPQLEPMQQQQQYPQKSFGQTMHGALYGFPSGVRSYRYSEHTEHRIPGEHSFDAHAQPVACAAPPVAVSPWSCPGVVLRERRSLDGGVLEQVRRCGRRVADALNRFSLLLSKGSTTCDDIHSCRSFYHHSPFSLPSVFFIYLLRFIVRAFAIRHVIQCLNRSM